MKTRFCALALAALLAPAAALAAADAPRPSRVDFTSRPDDVNVFVDGALRGVTPLTLFDVAPGRHHVRFESRGAAAADYEPADDFFTADEGSCISRHVELRPAKGLLLLTSEPSGAAITLNRMSLGETPRLVTTLDATGKYLIKFEKTGYQPRTAEVRFNGRAPLVVHERLVLDSGVLNISSDPAGAEVAVNGVPRGATPVRIDEVPKGHVLVKTTMKGYKDDVRELVVAAGDELNLTIPLTPLPGKLTLASVPGGARIYVDGDIRGVAPIDVAVKPGRHSVRAEMEGCETQTAEIDVGLGEAVTREFRMDSTLGSIEIRTKPAGAQVLLDGRPAGTTRAGGGSVSQTLRIDGVPEGCHTLEFRLQGHADARREVSVVRRAPLAVDVSLTKVFTPDIRVKALGSTYEGELVAEGPDYIDVMIKPGMTRRFHVGEIRSTEHIGPKK